MELDLIKRLLLKLVDPDGSSSDLGQHPGEVNKPIGHSSRLTSSRRDEDEKTLSPRHHFNKHQKCSLSRGKKG